MTAETLQRRRRRLRTQVALAFDLRKAMFALPNLFTLSSVFCGFYGIIQAGMGSEPRHLYRAGLAVFFGIFFDMVDGRVARLTRTQSAFGVQIDSLADVITFGVAPAVIVYRWALTPLHGAGVLIGFVYVACAAIRLARFNVLASRAPGPVKSFIGVPTPTAAGVLVSLVIFHQETVAGSVTHVFHIVALVLIVSYLMVSNVRYRTFKDFKFTKKGMTILFTVIVLFALVAARVRPTFALLLFFWGYLTLGLIEEVVFFRQRRESVDRPPPSEASTPPESQSRERGP